MDLNRLTQKSQEALHDAQTKALRFGHTEVDGEHLLLALLDQPDGLVPRLLDAGRRRPRPAARRARGRAGAAAPGHAARAPRPARCSSPSGSPGCSTPPSGRPSGSRTSTCRSSTWSSRCSTRARRPRPGRLLHEQGLTRDAFLAGADRRSAGNQRVTSAMPEVAYEALEKYGRDLVADARAGKLDPVIGRDAEIRRVDPDPVPQDQEQPGAHRRPRRRQDRHRRGAGPAHRPRRRARGAAGQDGLRPRHGLAGRRGEVPRRVRGAAQGGAQRGQGAPRAASCCSSTSCTPSSAPARPRARWTPATCSSRCSPAASCT